MKSVKAYVKDALYYRYFQYTEAATRGVLCKKVFLEISQNSQENTCARVSFLVKLQAQVPFLQNTSRRLLLSRSLRNVRNCYSAKWMSEKEAKEEVVHFV